MVARDAKTEGESGESKPEFDNETGDGRHETGDGADTPASPAAPTEVGGRDGPDPTRYGDWEKGGRCIDF